MNVILKGMFIGGDWQPGRSTFSDLNPSNDTLFAQVPNGGGDEALAAIDVAHGAFPQWAALPFSERAHHVRRIAEVIERRKMDLVAEV